MTRIHELLVGRGCRVSYPSVGRFIRRRGWRRRSASTVRMSESEPGEVAEMDFGRLGLMDDPEAGRRRVVWALIVVLSYSRHSFVWPTFSQKLVEVIEGLEAAWAFFEGVPSYLVVDNFPAAVAGPDPLHPRLTRGFLEYSQHRGFIADPARVRHPRDKPRVERGVPYVRERFFKGGKFTGLADMRSAASRWCLEVAGQRIHGTTRKQPLAVFREQERSALRKWDAEPYEMTDWRTAKVHPDHHVACQYALYSVPAQICPSGQKVEVRLGSKLVRIYHRGRLIKVHPRKGRGGRSTDPDDYPSELSAYTLRAPDPDQAQRGIAWAGGGRLCRAPLRRSVALGENQAGTQGSYVSENATPPSGWTQPAGGPCRLTSSTSAASSAYSSRPSSRRPRSRSYRPYPTAGSQDQAPSSLMTTPSPLNQHRENAHDHHRRTHAASQAPQARSHARHAS